MTERKENLKEFLIRTLADPVLLYVVIAMMSIMNHYRSIDMWKYAIVSYVAGWFIFRLFDYINKHRIIGAIAYILLLSGFVTGSSAAIELGNRNYPLTWGIWFLTPVNAVQYNKWYTIAIFLLFLIFMLSVIYYFTRVRYRIFMNFLILIIPFSIYGKENEEMKIGFIVALCVGFFVVLANFRQMSDTKEAKAVDRPEMFRSAAVFTVIFALLSAFVPKPQIEADRTMIDTMINAEALTDKFLNMLSIFQDDSDGEQFRRNMGNIPMYYAWASQPVQLKTSTFTSYSFETDKWTYSQVDSEYWYRDEIPFPIYYDGGVAEAVMCAAENNSEFAENYGLTEFVGLPVNSGKELKIRITAANKDTNAAPVPAGASSMEYSSYVDTLGLTKSGVVFSHNNKFTSGETFSFSYVTPAFFAYENNKKIVEHIAAIEDYNIFLLDAYWSLPITTDEEVQKHRDVLSENMEFYEYAKENYLDYGGSEKIYNLAQKLTAGVEAPYEKAKILEMYFIENDFVYDLSYRKANGENAEDFLFDTKRGVCYEYATAMTLLARAAGIPARYCEGYNMQTEFLDDNGNNFIVTANDAHGFPELYIKGYGWMCFEPTRTNAPIEKEEENVAALLAKTGIVIFICFVILLLFIRLMPLITHKLFIFIARRKSPNGAVAGVVRRIYKVYGIPNTASVHEAEGEVYRRSAADISDTVILFEKAEYGEITLTEEEKTIAIATYISAYEAFNEAKKAERKLKRKKAEQNK